MSRNEPMKLMLLHDAPALFLIIIQMFHTPVEDSSPAADSAPEELLLLLMFSRSSPDRSGLLATTDDHEYCTRSPGCRLAPARYILMMQQQNKRVGERKEGKGYTMIVEDTRKHERSIYSPHG